MRYKAVLFDMDGTVLDTLGDLTDAVNHTLRLYDMPERCEAEIASFLGNGAQWLLRCSAPEGTQSDILARMLKDYAPWYNEHCRIKTAPYPGITELMGALRDCGIKQAVISNKQDPAVRALAEQHFPGLLELAVGESASVRRKPSPDSVNAALSAMGVSAAESIYVGDTEVDLATAANAGTACAAVSWGFRSREQLAAAGAELIFDSAQELKAYLLSE